MTDSKTPSNEPVAAATKAPSPSVADKRNPALRAMGLPNFKLKLPSRNWLIFLSVTGTFTGLLLYDRHYKKKAQQKWCQVVSHIAKEPLDTARMPRKLTVFLAAPPGDGIGPSREYFREYIKPILVAGALDYDVVEGRREGDIRSKLATMIRQSRRQKGEQGSEEVKSEIISEFRRGAGIRAWDDVNGDLVVGRHAWKEYVRGLHEGWLGPLEIPRNETEILGQTNVSTTDDSSSSSESKDDTSTSQQESNDQKEQKDKKPSEGDKKPTFPPIRTETYSSLTPSPFLPEVFEPSAPVAHTHVLGFLNTPSRIYRFLRRRYLADEIGRETAAIVLAASRPYSQAEGVGRDSSGYESGDSPIIDDTKGARWEQQEVLAGEEANWHKSVRKPQDDMSDRPWLEDVVLDHRIAERMRRFQISKAAEETAQRIAEGRKAEETASEA